MELEKILEAAETEGMTRAEIQTYINYCFKSCVRDSRSDSYDYLVTLFDGFKPEFSVEEARERVSNLMKHGLMSEEQSNFNGVLHGIIPEDEIRSLYYEQWNMTYVSEYATDPYTKIRFLERLTGVKIPFTQGEIEERYKTLLEKKDMRNIVKLLETTKYQPENVQGLYGLFLDGNNFEFYHPYIHKIEKITGTAPVFDEGAVKQTYLRIWRGKSASAVFLLKNITKVPYVFTPENINELYLDLFNEKRYDRMLEVRTHTQVNPPFTIQEVNACASACAERGDVKSLEALRDLFKDEKITVNTKSVERGYMELAKNRGYESMQEIYRLIRVPLPKRVIDTIMEGTAEAEDEVFEEKLCVVQRCNAKPDEGLINKRLAFLLDQSRWNAYSRLMEITKIEQSEDVYRRAARAMKREMSKNPEIFIGY